MAEENTSKNKEIENSFDTNPQETTMSEEGSVRTVIVKDVGNVEDVISLALKGQEKCASKTNEVLIKPPSGSLRRYSTGAIGKLEVQSRYRGNHHVPSTHDLCKHGKLHDHHRDDAVKPWTVVRKTSVEGSVAVKAEATSGLRRRSLGSLMSRQIPAGTKLESLVDAKRDALAVKKKPCASVNSEETSSVSKMARSVDGSSFRSNDKPRKNKGTETTLSGGSAVVKKVLGLGSEKSSSNVYTPKSLKNKEKAKAQTISGEGLKEKTVCVVEDSVVKDVQSEKKLKASSSEKKTMRSRLKSLTTPTKQVPGTVLTTKKKESGDAELVAKKIRPKKTGVKVTLAKQLSSKKGKTTLEPKLEEQLETQTEVGKKKKKNLKGVDETRSVSCEGSKREKVVLRRRNGQGMKKKMTLFNGVIEETMNKLMKVRKTKVKALIGAFESVISLQDTKTPPQSKASTSESQVSPLGSKQ